MKTRHYSSTLPDHSGKLIDQRAADGDAGLKHEPMRKREKARRSASRPKKRDGYRHASPPQPEQHMDNEHE
jgi:hypothetical protein